MKATYLSIDRELDKEDMVHKHNEVLVIKRNEIMPFSTTWMDLEIVTLSEVSETRTNIV